MVRRTCAENVEIEAAGIMNKHSQPPQTEQPMLPSYAVSSMANERAKRREQEVSSSSSKQYQTNEGGFIIMNKKAIANSLLLVFALTLIGCASSGMFPSANLTDVQLQRGNFKIVAHNVSGESEAGYLFGESFPMGMATNTLAAFRVSGSGMLYKEALENLWKNYEATYGAVEGKRLALVNVRYDSEALNLLIYTRPKVMIRADVVEFAE